MLDYEARERLNIAKENLDRETAEYVELCRNPHLPMELRNHLFRHLMTAHVSLRGFRLSIVAMMNQEIEKQMSHSQSIRGKEVLELKKGKWTKVMVNDGEREL